MLTGLNIRTMFLVFCALATASFPAQAAGPQPHRRDKEDDTTRWLFAIRGTNTSVAAFLALYKDAYDLGYPLRAACDFPMTVDANNLLWVCDPTPDVIAQISDIWNRAPHSLDLAVSTVTSDTCGSPKKCHTDGAGCSYYSGPYCTIPGCYHTGYYCAGLHSCL